jgi:aminopeptidase N
MFRMRAFRVGLLAAAVSAALLGAALPASAAPSATPGSPGVGDRLYPLLGNGGYDALHYDLALRYATAAPSSPAVGTITMTARATQALSRFDLDYSGGALGGVTVDGAPATYTRPTQELAITPAKPISKGATFTVVVSGFTATPTPPDGSTAAGTAFFLTGEGSATAGQADGMHAMFPSNDHPSDKASFTFTLDVPSNVTAVANGVLAGRSVAGARTTWTYEQKEPMATELTQIVVGAYTVIPRGSVGGVVVRDVVPTAKLADYRTKLDVEKKQLAWMVARVGPYPFPVYGTLVVTAPDLGFALETQTLSIFDTTWFDLPEGVWSPTMTHELAHQWFGDSVAPAAWTDIWQNEGHATWYEITWAEENGQLDDDYGYPTVEALMRDIYADGDQARADHGPVARPLSGSVDDLFSSQAYDGGALVLYALRQKIGPAAFARVERAWAQALRGRSGGTAAFIATASVASGQNLLPFLGAWLYGTKTPPMPGHPDWTVNPVGAAKSSAKAAAPNRPTRR